MSDLKIFTDNIEPTALNQIYTLVKQPAFADCKVRIMPDVHAGLVVSLALRLIWGIRSFRTSLALTLVAVC